jgi:type IV pilus assembly protein PilB
MRRICTNCKEPQKVPEKLWEQLHLDPKKEAEFTYYKGRGCDRCKNKGYAGRCAILEMIPATEPIRKLVIERATASEIKQTALQEGMLTLRMTGLLKAREGISTLEEVLNVTTTD